MLSHVSNRAHKTSTRDPSVQDFLNYIGHMIIPITRIAFNELDSNCSKRHLLGRFPPFFEIIAIKRIAL